MIQANKIPQKVNPTLSYVDVKKSHPNQHSWALGVWVVFPNTIMSVLTKTLMHIG